MIRSSKDVRKSIEENWREYLSRYGNLYSSKTLSGSSPPSVFVGTYNYPNVNVGPMVPPIHGDTSLLDIPERWLGKSLEEIVNFRLSLVRGIQKASVLQPEGRYIENLQEAAMAIHPIDADIEFHKNTVPITSLDSESAPFGPIGEIKNAKFTGSSSQKTIESAYYDKDLTANEAILKLYNNGIDLSQIQKCFSIGMLGKKRKLVPTRWSITATDDIICKHLIDDVLNYSLIDSCRVFSYNHLGNIFAVVLFPHRWIYEMIEAWYSNGVMGFGSDYEDARGIDHPPAIAGAYFAAKLGVLEYLHKKKIQAGVVILREIRPEYAIPVGVWQVREGIRKAMLQNPTLADNFDHALNLASNKMSISKIEWLLHGNIVGLIKQKTMSDFF